MATANPWSITTRDNFKNAHLLLIEDNPDQALIIRKAVQQCLPEVTLIIAATEAEALKFLSRCEQDDYTMPKLILLDLYLPDSQTGWRLLDEVKKHQSLLSKVPVVLLSSSAHHTDITEAYRRGCSSYIVKPDVFEKWLTYFRLLRSYWWESAVLPKVDVALF